MELRLYGRNGPEAEKVTAWCGGRQTALGLIVPTDSGPVLARRGDLIAMNRDGGFEVIAGGPQPGLFDQDAPDDLK
jgi:hypothetical protein